MEDDDDFEYQLQQEQEEKCTAETKEECRKNPHFYKDPTDGTEYEWDPVKRAWFPRINDDFIAQYQAQYGNFEPSDEKKSEPESVEAKESDIPEAKVAQVEPEPEPAEVRGRKRPNEEPPQWFEVSDEHNTNVYVSNLPKSMNEEEFVKLMQKYGLIMKDDRNKLKIKLYRDEEGNFKGDARCCYIKRQSVDLALKLLDGMQFDAEHCLKVELATFTLKGQYDPSLKPKKSRKNRKDKEKQKKRLEKLFDWRPEKLIGERGKNEKIVVIKNMFDVSMFEKDPKLILEYRSDLRDECEENCGPVRKVEIYDRHPEGVATIAFNEFEHADKCVELMDGRFFAGRKLDAALWDGKTKFKIRETEEEIEKRLKKWDDFLEKGE